MMSSNQFYPLSCHLPLSQVFPLKYHKKLSQQNLLLISQHAFFIDFIMVKGWTNKSTCFELVFVDKSSSHIIREIDTLDPSITIGRRPRPWQSKQSLLQVNFLCKFSTWITCDDTSLKNFTNNKRQHKLGILPSHQICSSMWQNFLHGD